ncbi:P-loop containing nucleoside triphosphate hydrolase protein [Hyaloraphidium curvatum]|nr:P-loop containing nucleoside triphosphate hydrolase protein [Hyaloraphidium curvatum]
MASANIIAELLLAGPGTFAGHAQAFAGPQAANASADGAFSLPGLQGTLVTFLATYFFGPAASLFLSNQIFSGGLALMVMGFLLDSLRQRALSLYRHLLDMCYVSLTITEKEEVYSHVSEYLYQRLSGEITGERIEADQLAVHTAGKVRRLVAKSFFVDKYQTDPYYDQRMDPEARRPKLVFVPDQGDYDLWVHGRRVRVSCGSQASAASEDAGRGSSRKRPESVITFSTWAPRGDTKLLRDMIKEAVDLGYAEASDKTMVFSPTYDRWRRTATRKPRSFESVILKDGVKEDLVNDIRTFQTSRDWYAGCGVPYRRGYLLFGPPGCGKSSIIVALAGHLGLSVCVVSLSSPVMSDQTLNELMIAAPPDSILLLEDVDAAFPPEDTSKPTGPVEGGNNMRAGNGSSVTLSGLLNALDGIAAQEGSLVFLTTNHPERLPPALLRPGRVDKRIFFGKADRSQVRRMALKFFPVGAYPGQDVEALADEIAERIGEGTQTTAALQGLFMAFRVDGPRGVLDGLDNWLKEQAEEEARLANKVEEAKKAAEAKTAEECAGTDKAAVKRAKKKADAEIKADSDLSDSSSDAGTDVA